MTGSIDDVLDRMRWVDAVEACVDTGVTERPPVAGASYAAFAVTPPHRGNVLALAIAHREDEKVIVDVIKDDLDVAEVADMLARYGVSRLSGAEGDESDALAHAVAGVFQELRALQ